ncbi:MAG TPA: site-2 protease family protein [Candidatus Tumulicola sp.]|nr:site-2 protease family protein [Candidatus Tumulicola sp.]
MRMRWTWRVGKIAGIEIAVHPSWLIIYLLFAWSAATIAKLLSQELSAANDIVLGLIASLVLFASVVAHEFAHALVARRLGIPIGNITLFLFGGVASILREPGTPADEIKMAGAGPLASIVIGLVFYALALACDRISWLWGFTFCWLLAVANGMLALFNLLPAFPSDGGRLLRAVLWRIYGSQARATSIASIISAGVAVALVGLGAYEGIALKEPRGWWLVLIALFLWQAALASGRQARINLALERTPVGDCMARRLIPVPTDASIASFVGGLAADGSVAGYPVVSDGALVGLVTLHDTTSVPPELWPHTPVSAIMTPADKLPTIAPDVAASEALTKLTTSGARNLAVMDNGVLTGVVSEESIFTALRSRDAKA